MTEQRRVLYSGRVQGVGFRYTSKRVAGGHNITGFVCNHPDGTVELVAEGNTEELDRFFAEIGETMGHHIHDAHVQIAPASGQYGTFEIRV